MKLFILLFLVSGYAFGQCQNKIDPKKAILFIDTNFSDQEIATAQKSACARGERLLTIPKNYKDYTSILQEYKKAEIEFEKKCKNIEKTKKECEKAYEFYTQLSSKKDNFVESQKEFKEQIEELKNELESQNVKISSLIISGHNGGGEISGGKGDVDKSTIEELFKQSSIIENMNSLLLLGCYTTTESEVKDWTDIFPHLRIIAGYDGSAPLSDKPIGHQYLAQILAKEKQLYSQADEKKLLAVAKNGVSALFGLNSAMYVSCNLEDEKGFFYGSESTEGKFKLLKDSSCIKKEAELVALDEKFNRYKSGELEPPKDTRNGELRQIYNKARSLEHCIEESGIGPNADKVFQLLFYEGIKDSFAAFYKPQIEEMTKLFPNGGEGFWIPTKENLRTKTRKELLSNLHNLTGYMTKIGAENPNYPSVRIIATTMAVHLDMLLNNPFSWHEYKSGTPTKPQTDYTSLK